MRRAADQGYGRDEQVIEGGGGKGLSLSGGRREREGREEKREKKEKMACRCQPCGHGCYSYSLLPERVRGGRGWLRYYYRVLERRERRKEPGTMETTKLEKEHLGNP